MASYRELLTQVKQRITEIQPADAETRLGQATFLDVREQDEHDQGTIPGSVFIPRGHLESQAAGKLGPKRHAHRRLLRRRQPIGVRRRDARSSSGTPTSCRWPAASAAGRAKTARGSLPPRSMPSSATATAATSCSRRSASPASSTCSRARCSCSAPAASDRPPRSTSRPRASARSASSTWTSSTRRTCSGRSCTTWTASASARSTPPRRRSRS